MAEPRVVCEEEAHQKLLGGGCIIILEGGICARKSTALRTFKKKAFRDSNNKSILYCDEAVDLNMIEEFKQKRESAIDKLEQFKWTMELQNYIMFAREKAMKEAQIMATGGFSIIMERASIGNLIFAQNSLWEFLSKNPTHDEFMSATQIWFQYQMNLINMIQKRGELGCVPILTVFMKTPIRESIELNKLRDEHPYPPEYLREVHNIYKLMLNVIPEKEIYVFNPKKIAEEFGLASSEDLVEEVPKSKGKLHIFSDRTYNHILECINKKLTVLKESKAK